MNETEANKTVLLIAYYFPPLGLGGVGRPYGLFRYLPQYGYNVIVLTVKDILYPQYDYSLLNKEDESKIIRAGSLDPSRILYLFGKRKQDQSIYPNLSRRLPLFNPDSKRGWIYFAKRKLKNIIGNQKIDIVITTAPPPSVNLLGLYLKKISNIPWVADLRDYWFSLPIEKIYSGDSAKNYSLHLKEKIQQNADEIISVNNDINRYYGRGEVIMNAADSAVIEGWKSKYSLNENKFTIGLLGTFNYLVPAEPLFKTISKLINTDKLSPDKIEIVHAGYADSEFDNLTAKYNLKSIVIKKGYLKRSEAIKALLPSDLLYFSVGKFDEYNILPGRVFDYLVSGKQILGVVPENSDSAALLNNYPMGSVITDYDTDKIASYLIDAFKNKTKSAANEKTFDINLEQFSMKTMAEKYAKVLDRLI